MAESIDAGSDHVRAGIVRTGRLAVDPPDQGAQGGRKESAGKVEQRIQGQQRESHGRIEEWKDLINAAGDDVGLVGLRMRGHLVNPGWIRRRKKLFWVD